MAKRGQKTPKKNGKAKKSGTSRNGTPKTVGPRTKKVTISSSEKEEIAPLLQQLRESKMALADVQLQIMRAESKRMELAENILKLDSVLLEKAKGTAASHGIDLDNPARRWSLDTEEGVFTRVE